MAKNTNDRALRFYHEVLGLERLHYGLWRLQDELTFDNLRAAQQRYEDMLTDNIPSDVKSILDVGCGTGVMSAKLKSLGHNVEGLTPDIHQIQVIQQKNTDIKLHACKFEDFQPAKAYDCIIMSESSQYIPLHRLFKVAAQALKTDGYLMVCDYFVLNHAKGIIAKSGHNYEAFLSTASDNKFKVLQSKDITRETAKTLEMGDNCCERVLLAIDIATEKIRRRYPRLTRIILRLLNKEISKRRRERKLLDAELFIANKQYQYVLFQINAQEMP